MKKALVLVSAMAALTVTATPAQAATPTTQAKGHVRVLRPLQISYVQDLNFGTVVLAGGALGWSSTISVDQTGVRDCDGGSGEVLCSDTPAAAVYRLVGTNMQTVVVSVSPTINLANLTDATQADLVMDVDAPATVALGASGNAGVEFGIDGSITVDASTADGVYEGTFDVSADYQ